MKIIKNSFVFLLFLILISGCEGRQPMKLGPFISGRITGLPEGVFSTIYFRPLPNEKPALWTDQKNGEWKVALPSENDHYLVIVEAPGYKSSPTSYTLQMKDQKAFIEIDGKITSQEANNLDFVFTLKQVFSITAMP
jgi:hypothetical protein